MLEVCIDSLESALNAIHGGADEIEVCSSLAEGGLTPSLGLVKLIQHSVSLCYDWVMLLSMFVVSSNCCNIMLIWNYTWNFLMTIIKILHFQLNNIKLKKKIHESCPEQCSCVKINKVR